MPPSFTSSLVADIALPLVFLLAPLLAVWCSAFMIFTEAGIGSWILGLPYPRLLRPTLAMNLLSSLVGVPVVGVLAAIAAAAVAGSPTTRLEYVVAGIGWGFEVPREHLGDVATGHHILLILMYLGSVAVELWTAKRLFPDASPGQLRRWIWLANTVSYAPILLFFVWFAGP
jgi:hypothetical protein